ncbi:hypothetical protein BY996DRAFT_2981895 [Phakopsora pachyrhizi]|nr:hypothetical protein BY996DRAFT_2981895 [Phakopsora pachyrhizi]
MPKPANVSSLAECHSGDRSQPGIGSNTDYSPYVYQSLRSVQAVASSIDAMSGSEPGAICLEAHSPLEDSLYQRSQLGLNHNSSRTTIQSKLVLSHSNPQTLKPEGQASDGGIYIDDRDSYCFQAAAEGYSEARGITAGGRSSHNNSHWPSWVRANDGTKTLATPGLLRCSSAVEDVAEHGYADPKTWAQPFECHYFDPSLQESFPPSSSQTSTPPESSIIPTCTTLRPFEPTGRVFPNTRSKEGLPSNSHHLLNSPEMTNLQVTETSNFNQAACTTLKEEPNITRGEKSIHAETGKHLNNASQSPTQSPRMTRSSVASRRAHATPKKIKVLSSQNLSSGTADLQADPPSDDAASILLSLSRNEPSKHGMALRRGRGGVSRSEQPLSATLSSEKPHLSPTTSNKRYRTRSQIHEENVVTSNSPEAPPMELNSLLGARDHRSAQSS